jgi:hypothetical protein
MNNRLFVLIVASICAAAVPASSQELKGPLVIQRAMNFESAVRDQSTSPRYVSINFTDENTGLTQHTCVFGWDLVIAISREYGIDHSKAIEIALKSQNYSFHFSKKSALDALPIKFSEEDFVNVREHLAPLSDEMLRAGLSTWLNNEYREPRLRAAAACVLVERGLEVAVSDRSRSLYIPKNTSDQNGIKLLYDIDKY